MLMLSSIILNFQISTDRFMTAKTDTTNAISPKRNEDFSEWYQQVVKAADLAENSPVRGSMVIKPWGYAIWERVQKELDRRIRETGHENVYFPLFIPLHFFEKEAAHVEGFAKECAVVTHHRLEEKEGKLVPGGLLEEPLIVRPTSETIIGEAFSRWVSSYRDLPLLVNQWANVVRWEMRPRLFLRTTEFLWQEGHTAHASMQEAREEALKMLGEYQQLMEGCLSIPVIKGEKSPGEKFPGAEKTFTLEAMMQDGKALQSCTSHDLGQNFARASSIRFSNPKGELEYAYTTSWGLTTRVIGGLIMCHADDDGLRLPPFVAPHQMVLLPVTPSVEAQQVVWPVVEKLAAELRKLMFRGEPVRVFVDRRDRRGGEKNWEWIKKGVPLRIEVGPRDMATGSVVLMRRDQPASKKYVLSQELLLSQVEMLLEEIQTRYYVEARNYQRERTRTDIRTREELKQFFQESAKASQGFVLAKWCGDAETEKMLEDGVTIRCIPEQQSHTQGRCVLTGRPATLDVIFAKSY